MEPHRAETRPRRRTSAWRAAAAAVALALGAGCARGVNDYLAEARSNKPEAVKDAVVAIGGILYRKESASIPFDDADREALLYLRDVASGDQIPINRAAAVAALARIRRADAGDVFIGALRDPFWLVRLESARGIELQPDERYAQPLREALDAETRAEARIQMVKALGKVGGPVALRTLLDLFFRKSESGVDPQLETYLAIRQLTGLTHGIDELDRWREYYKTKYGEAPGGAASPSAAGAEDGGSRPQ